MGESCPIIWRPCEQRSSNDASSLQQRQRHSALVFSLPPCKTQTKEYISSCLNSSMLTRPATFELARPQKHVLQFIYINKTGSVSMKNPNTTSLLSCFIQIQSMAKHLLNQSFQNICAHYIYICTYYMYV